MKLRFRVFLFVLFVTLADCDLIPNDRVIVNPGITEDPNLVEGIVYKIVHLKSGSHLNRDGNDKSVYVDSASDPNQYWSIRKVDGNEYNLVNMYSNMYLNGNGQDVYVSNPSSDNQRWKFKKVTNDSYNIAHVESGSRNLDSNGHEVYISNPKDNSEFNPFQRWSFEPSHYNLSALVMNFEYPPDLKENLDRYKTRTGLLFGDYTFKNPSDITLEQTIDETEIKMNTYTLEIKKSNSVKNTRNVNVSFNLGRFIFRLLGINTGFHAGIKREFTSIDEQTYRETVEELVSYHVRQKFIVPPYTSVMVNVTVDKVRIDIPFNATIRVTGKADRLDENGNVIQMTNVNANAVRCYLQKENYKNIKVEGDSLIVDTSGILKVEGYGLGTLIETHPIEDPDAPKGPLGDLPPDEPKTPGLEMPNFFYFFYLMGTILYLIPIFAVTFILYKFYELFRLERPGYVKIS